MTAALSNHLSLTGDQLRVVAARIGAHDLPAILAARPGHTAIDRREAAFVRAARELGSRNLIGNSAVHPDLVPILQTLARPDRELTMRLASPDGAARIRVMRRKTLCVLACAIGDDIVLRVIGQCVEVRDVIAALLAELPRAKPADIEIFGAPLSEVAARLSGTHEPLGLADQIRALGAPPHVAALLGSVLASRQAYVEIVYSALADTAGRICRGPAAVAVFYTKRGRIVGAPSASPTGQLWTTLKPGSDHAIDRAIGELIALGDQGWAPEYGNGS